MNLNLLANMKPDRRLIVIASVAAFLLLLIGFGAGRVTASDSGTTPESTSTSSSTTTSVAAPPDSETTTTLNVVDGDASASLEPTSAVDLGDAQVYGTDTERETFLNDLVEAGVVGGSREGLLATADHVCYMLERLEDQNRTPAFAVRVVWNESLADLRPEDLAAFAVVFNAAPRYLCPESIEYSDLVAYWLGY